MRQSGIYAIRNKLNGHQYVGSAINVARRWANHLSDLRKGTHHSRKLQRAWVKHSAEAFEFIILEVVDDVTRLITVEQQYLDTLRPFYNISPTAGSPLGVKHSAEVRAHNRLVHLGQKRSPEAIAKGLATRKSRPPTPGELAKTGRKQSAKTIAKRIAAIKARPPTPAEIARDQKMAAYLRERNQSAEFRSFVSAIQQGKKYPNRPLTEKQLQALSTGRALGPAAAAHAKHGKPLSEETRQKLSISVSAGKKGKPLTEKQIAANVARRGRPVTEKQRAAYEARKQRTIAQKQDPNYQKQPRQPTTKWLAYLERRKTKHQQSHNPVILQSSLWDEGHAS